MTTATSTPQAAATSARFPLMPVGTTGKQAYRYAVSELRRQGVLVSQSVKPASLAAVAADPSIRWEFPSAEWSAEGARYAFVPSNAAPQWSARGKRSVATWRWEGTYEDGSTVAELMVAVFLEQGFDASWDGALEDGVVVDVRSWMPWRDDAAVAALAASPTLWTREAVAVHPTTSPAVLRLLALDEEETVRDAAASNPRTPVDAVMELAQDAVFFVSRRAVMTHTDALLTHLRSEGVDVPADAAGRWLHGYYRAMAG